jgi:hypothetical protein
MSEDEPVPTAAIQPKSPPEGYKTWNDYWTREHNQPWRTEPEIGAEQQRFLAKLRNIQSNSERYELRPQPFVRLPAGFGWAGVVGPKRPNAHRPRTG